MPLLGALVCLGAAPAGAAGASGNLAGGARRRRRCRTGIRQCDPRNEPAACWRPASRPSNIHRLSASAAELGAGVEPAAAELLLRRIADLPARPGDRCLIFLTSHGERGAGLWLARSNRALTPDELARALSRGCAAVPTVVIVSACYSGSFATGKMAKPNRVILTAARGGPAILRLSGPPHLQFLRRVPARRLAAIGDLACGVRRSQPVRSRAWSMPSGCGRRSPRPISAEAVAGLKVGF